jgi:Lipocalin-like domain
MSKKSLREQLVGAWTLTSCVLRDITTGAEDRPFGERPLGLILYTPDGYMSAQLQRPERPLFADGDLAHATRKNLQALEVPTSPIQVGFSSTNRKPPYSTKWR